MIVAGLIATPTNCDCGAGISHPHSLFLLPGHHHDSSGRHVRLDAPGEHPHTMQAAVDRGPRLAAFSGHASESIAMMVAAFLSMTVLWRRLRQRIIDLPLPPGYQHVPDPPPPRLVPLTVFN
ncbi:MAG TPA: hypothetical protein VKZ96_07650 [Thermomicrobiales bacterium]|nr:hypothetical protein [Thermomicrobiales bacterium]